MPMPDDMFSPRAPWSSTMTRSESGYGSGFSTTRCTTAKIDVFAPMARASVRHGGQRERRIAREPPRRIPDLFAHRLHGHRLS